MRKPYAKKPYALMKNGMYYAHNSCGYVHNILNAEIYDEKYAKCYAEQCDEVTAIPITDVISSKEYVQEFIDRMEVMRDAIDA